MPRHDAPVGVPPPWFKRRGYPHFDRAAPKEYWQTVANLVTNPGWVARRAFMPFISFSIDQLRYKKQPDGSRKSEIKSRPVAFASHTDSHIFAYYSHLLGKRYEAVLSERGLGECVLAYRTFHPPKCNIHFANETFRFIESVGECVVVALDIEKFFDTIPHRELKRLWAIVLGAHELPADHYAVFKAVTRWSKVERDDAFKALGIGRRRQESWRGPLCTPEVFRTKIRDGRLITPGFAILNGSGIGIPQGSPISALLSNVVMLELDTALADAARRLGALYRRYSDDLLLIGSAEAVAELEPSLKAAVARLGLEINDTKTKRSIFRRAESSLLVADTPVQYLGFTFDGSRVLVRPQTLSKYIQRMKRGVRTARRAAVAAARRGGSRKLKRSKLYARYSHLGPSRQMMQSPASKSMGTNFFTYSKRAATIMGHKEILRQLRKHWQRLNAEIHLADNG